MKKGLISFDFHWPDHNKKIDIKGLPSSLSGLLQANDGVLMPITDNMVYDKDYRITIKIEKIC